MPLNLDDAFTRAGQLAMLGWLALILLPRWRGISAALAGWIIPALLSLGYSVLIAVHWHDAKGSFSTLDSVAALFASKPLLLAGWVHYLAFDLFVGNWILRRSQAEGIPHWLMLPVLLMTFLFGPFGFIAYLLLEACFRLAREDRIARLQARLPSWLPDLELEPRLTAAALAMFALAVPTLFAWLVDVRQFQGVDTWIKPLKFEISVAFYLLTLALFLPLAGERFRASWAGRYIVWPVIVPIVLEVLYIAWRASRVEASHYNSDSALGIALYSLMGIGAVMFTIAPGFLAYGLARRDAAPMPDVVRWSLVVGLALTCVFGLLSGALLGSSPTGHYVGAVPVDHRTLPIFGWSLAIGDLRIAHFLGLHALQIIPVVGVLLWLATRQSRTGLVALGTVSTAYAGITTAALVAALQARPLLGLG
ncbi:ABA4-like family protein [Bosea vestrisii]|uniref:ABA4-like family protein n=1 Tax=Bosea vestrisii TaxID=151416 RepID=UPI0024DF9A0B|nr:ABA4-like family protein [Bosea vestrisii]WID97622.1 ABA4-like family protein [Bosea vestrisii]